MKRTPSFLWLSFFVAFGFTSSSHAVEVLHWDRLPLPIPLVVGQERVIFIDRNVRVGVPTYMGEQLRVQSAAGVIYLRATVPIASTRLQVQDAESGALILIDVRATAAKEDQTPLEPVRIVVADHVIQSSHTVDQGDGENTSADHAVITTSHETPLPVILTRYAAQNLYAPLRTVEPISTIEPIHLRDDLALETLLPTLPVHAKTLAAWRLDDFWVTAVRLTNTSNHWVDLDPRVLLGDFIAATFQHANVGPAGNATDTTVVYLVTHHHGLAESLLPAISPFNASLNLPPTASTITTPTVKPVEESRDAQ